MDTKTPEIVAKARKFAIEKHRGQTYGKNSYIMHVVKVVAILKDFGYTDPTVIGAAWLHDVLEQTHTSREELQQNFGLPISYVVWALTGEYGINRIDRLQGMIAKLKSSKIATIIKLADAIANIEFYKSKSDARMYRVYIREILYLKEMLYKPKQNNCQELLPLWQRLIAAASLTNRDRKDKNRMTAKFECLEGVVITRELADAIAAFEYKHGDKSEDMHAFANLDEVAGDFIKALVKFSREALEDEDNFYHDTDKAGVITLILLENGADVATQDAYDAIEEKIGTIEGGDETYNLMIEVINAVVLTDDSKMKVKN